MGSGPHEVANERVEVPGEYPLCPPCVYETGVLKEDETVPYHLARRAGLFVQREANKDPEP